LRFPRDLPILATRACRNSHPYTPCTSHHRRSFALRIRVTAPRAVDRLRSITLSSADYPFAFYSQSPLDRASRDQALFRLSFDITRLPNRSEPEDSRAGSLSFHSPSRVPALLFLAASSPLPSRAPSPLCSPASRHPRARFSLSSGHAIALTGIFQTVNCKSSNATLTVSRL